MTDETQRPRFFTDDGQSVPAVTTDEMCEVDRVAVDEAGSDSCR